MNHERWVELLKEHEFEMNDYLLNISNEALHKIREAGLKNPQYTQGTAREMSDVITKIADDIRAHTKPNDKEIKLLQYLVGHKTRFSVYDEVEEIDCDMCDEKYECSEDCRCDICLEAYAEAEADRRNDMD